MVEHAKDMGRRGLQRWGDKLIGAVGRYLGRHRRYPWVSKFRRLIARLHAAAENRDYDMDRNGESRILDCLSRAQPARVIFDVGANTGDWSHRAARAMPEATIHAFEVVPSTFALLREKVRALPQVRPVNMGLSDQEGVLDIHHDPAYPALATSVNGFSEGFHHYQPQVASLPVIKGSQYCKEQGIEHINLLKIDVEGHEPQVLKGFESMLQAGAIDVIQFEYGYVNIDTHYLLKDYYDYLGGLGMRIGKIFPNYVEFREYQHKHEDFYGPNFLAVRSSQETLIRALSGK